MEENQIPITPVDDCGFCPLISLFDKEGCDMNRKKCCKKYKKKGKHCKSCPKQ